MILWWASGGTATVERAAAIGAAGSVAATGVNSPVATRAAALSATAAISASGLNPLVTRAAAFGATAAIATTGQRIPLEVGSGTFGDGTFGGVASDWGDEWGLFPWGGVSASPFGGPVERVVWLDATATIGVHSLRVTGASPALRDYSDAGRLRSTLRLRHYVERREAVVLITDGGVVTAVGVLHPVTLVFIADDGTVEAYGQRVDRRVPVTAIGTWRS